MMTPEQLAEAEQQTRYLVGTADDVAKVGDVQRDCMLREIESGSPAVIPSLLVMVRRENAPEFEMHVNVLDVPVVRGGELTPVLAGLALRLVEERVFPVAAAFAAEAWHSVQERGKGPIVEPRLDPRRREVLAVAAAAMRTFAPAGGPLRSVIVPVKRGPKNEFLQDGEIQDRTHEYPGSSGHRAGSPFLAVFFRAYHLACNLQAPRAAE